jgi:hypothetical protein
MKKSYIIGVVSLILGILFFTGSCSSMIESITESMTMGADDDSGNAQPGPGETEEEPVDVSGIPGEQDIAGAWINKEYNNEGRSAKLVYKRNPDNSYSYTAYDKTDESGNVYKGRVVYSKRWFDDKGNLLGESKVTLEGGMEWKTLDRISKDGSTLEVQSGVAKINPSGPRYSIYYRE